MCHINHVGVMFPLRSAEATGGTAADGGVAQSRDAKEKRNAAQVFSSLEVLFWTEADCSHPGILS